MKWVRWGGDSRFDFRNTEPTGDDNGEPDNWLHGELIDCEKHAEWREVESGTLDTETGKFRLVLKPELSLLEAAENLINTNLYGMNKVQYDALTELQKAVHREKVQYDALTELQKAVHREEDSPTKPSKYTNEAVEEFIDAYKEYGGFLTYPDNSGGSMSRSYQAFSVLLKQRSESQS